MYVKFEMGWIDLQFVELKKNNSDLNLKNNSNRVRIKLFISFVKLDHFRLLIL